MSEPSDVDAPTLPAPGRQTSANEVPYSPNIKQHVLPRVGEERPGWVRCRDELSEPVAGPDARRRTEAEVLSRAGADAIERALRLRDGEVDELRRRLNLPGGP